MDLAFTLQTGSILIALADTVWFVFFICKFIEPIICNNYQEFFPSALI